MIQDALSLSRMYCTILENDTNVVVFRAIKTEVASQAFVRKKCTIILGFLKNRPKQNKIVVESVRKKTVEPSCTKSLNLKSSDLDETFQMLSRSSDFLYFFHKLHSSTVSPRDIVKV